jgi:voltage-gated potassium channel
MTSAPISATQPEAAAADQPPRQTVYLLFTLALSLFAIGLLAAETSLPLDDQTRSIFDYADTAICGLFFLDFLVSLARAENKRGYLVTWGWFDLLSSIPQIDVLRWGRAARILRIVRVLRAVRSAKVLADVIFRHRAQSAVLAAALLSIVLVVFGSVAVLHFERGQTEANIRGPDDALWWAVVTITTVGYGDKYPVSAEGRMIAGVLMTAGIGLFGTLSGLVASWFLAPDQGKQEGELAALTQEVRRLRESLENRHGRSLMSDGALDQERPDLTGGAVKARKRT